jgi:outer membrane protein
MILLGQGLFAQQGKVWTLQDCIDYALEQNIQVRKSALSIESNQAYADQAKAQRFPSVSAGVSQNFSWAKGTTTGDNSFSGSNGSSYSLNSSVSLYNGGRISDEIKQTALNVESGKYSTETTRESVSLSILNAFLQVLYAEELVKNSEKQIESTTQQLNLASERLNLQIISQADYAQVKSQLASEKLTLANSQSQLAISKVNLMQLMELPVTNDFTVSHPTLEESLNELRRPDVAVIYDTALAIKPQIKVAALNKQVASLDEKMARAGFLPTLSASAGVSSGFNGPSSTEYFDQINNAIKPTLGLSLSIPIYQRRQVKTSVAVARINVQNAELSETDTKNQLRKNIEQACQDVVSAQIKYEASLENFSATSESAMLSDEKFRQGIINSVDYLVSKTSLIVAESSLLQSKYNLIFSYKILDFYTGVSLSL